MFSTWMIGVTLAFTVFFKPHLIKLGLPKFMYWAILITGIFQGGQIIFYEYFVKACH